MERHAILNPDNDTYIWVLHYAFLPIINKHLDNWKATWIHHPLWTERNRTPMQLWIEGLHRAWWTQNAESESDATLEVIYSISTCTCAVHSKPNKTNLRT